VLYLCSFATAFAVLFHAFNIAVTSYQASYDPDVKAERYKRLRIAMVWSGSRFDLLNPTHNGVVYLGLFDPNQPEWVGLPSGAPTQ